MSLSVDKYLLDEMTYYEDLELMLENDVHDITLDHIFGWNEEEQTYNLESDELFPQPVHHVE